MYLCIPSETSDEVKATIRITRLTAHFTCGLMSDLMIYELSKCDEVYDVTVLSTSRYH